MIRVSTQSFRRCVERLLGGNSGCKCSCQPWWIALRIEEVEVQGLAGPVESMPSTRVAMVPVPARV